MSKLDKLQALCKENGVEFASLYRYRHLDQYVVTVHDTKLSGKEPALENMRDELDWMLEMDSWYRRGLTIIAVDENPNKVIELAIEYLNK